MTFGDDMLGSFRRIFSEVFDRSDSDDYVTGFNAGFAGLNTKCTSRGELAGWFKGFSALCKRVRGDGE